MGISGSPIHSNSEIDKKEEPENQEDYNEKIETDTSDVKEDDPKKFTT